MILSLAASSGRIQSRHQTKELASRYERSLQDSEATLEKAKSRFDVAAEELQRFLISKEGESSKEASMPGTAGKGGTKIGKTFAKGGMLLKVRSPANVSIFSPCVFLWNADTRFRCNATKKI